MTTILVPSKNVTFEKFSQNTIHITGDKYTCWNSDLFGVDKEGLLSLFVPNVLDLIEVENLQNYEYLLRIAYDNEGNETFEKLVVIEGETIPVNSGVFDVCEAEQRWIDYQIDLYDNREENY